MAAGAPRLGVEGTRFTVDGRPTFLLGISYYAGQGAPDAILRQDLDRIQDTGFNWLRVWTTWAAFGHDVSSVDQQGHPRPEFLERLTRLVEESGQRRLIVDVTFSRGNGATGPARLQGLALHRGAVDVVVGQLRAAPNWYLDLANERNIAGTRFVSLEELARLRQDVREMDATRLVTASHAHHELTRDDIRQYVQEVGLDVLTLHRQRSQDSQGQTAQRTRELLSWMHDLGCAVPIHYQEPLRRGYSTWEAPAQAFIADLDGAIEGGAAGWCFHNGRQASDPQGRPRRCFDLRDIGLFEQLDGEEQLVLREIKRRAGRST